MTVDVRPSNPTSAMARMFAIMGISTAPDPAVHHPTAIVGKKCRRPTSRPCVPLAGREVLPEALAHLACRVFQPRRLRLQFIEAGERGVQVCLVEELDAADQVAFERQKCDRRHSASKPSCEVPMPLCVTTAPRSPSRCTASM